MADDDDHERISRKAFEIWESEGHPHGRDQSHWDQAKEIIALHDSMGDTLLPRSTGAFEPEEPTQATEPYGDMPGLTDQGRDDLTDTDREPEITKPSHATYSLGDTAGHAARAKRDEAPDVDDDEVVTPAPGVAGVTPTPSDPTLGVPAPREAGKAGQGFGTPQAIAPESAAPSSSGRAAATPPTGLPPIATGAGQAPGSPNDARLGSGLQASPIGNSAPVTGKNPPRPAASPTSVTKGRSDDRR